MTEPRRAPRPSLPALRETSARIASHLAPPPRAPLPPSLTSELASLGPAMGVAPRSVSLVAAPGLAALAGSRAVAAGSAVLVDPARLPAASTERRGLLAHELAHVGQLRQPSAPAPAAAVEHEARGLAERARGGDPVHAPALAASPAQVWGDLGAAHVDVGALVTITRTGTDVHTVDTKLELTWNGDRFELRLFGDGVTLRPTLRYVGSDVASTTIAEWSDVRLADNPIDAVNAAIHLSPSVPRRDAATAPTDHLVLEPDRVLGHGGGMSIHSGELAVDVPRINQIGASYVVLALGEGLPDVTLYDDLHNVTAWTPALREHSFTLHINGRASTSGYRPFAIRSTDALPTAVAAELAAPMPETLHDSTVPASTLLTAAASDLTAALAAPDLDLGEVLPPAFVTILRTELARRAAAAPAAEGDPRTRQGAADLLFALGEARPRLRFLHTLRDSTGYLGGAEVGARAVERVSFARRQLATYVFAALDGDRARTSGLRQAALAAFVRLPFQIADLYLESGGGLARVEQGQRDVAFDIMQSRGHSHTGARTIDQLLGLEPDSNRVEVADRLRRRADELRAALQRGDPQVLTQLLEVTIDAQRKSGLLAIRAAHDQFTYFAQELDTLLDPVIGVVGGGSQGSVARRYRDQFDALLTAVEQSRTLVPARVDLAIAGFNAIVTPATFGADVEHIQARLRHIAVVRIVAKIVAVTAVAAIGGAMIGSVAGAGLATAARAFSLGRTATFVLVEGGSLAAEAGAFTYLSRSGEQLVTGAPPARGAFTDFAINFATLGLLRGVGSVYGAWRPAFRATSPRLFKAGGVAAGAVSAHVFGELVHVLETGHVMAGSDRGLAIVQNLALVGILHFGRYFTQPLEARLTRGVSSLLGSDRIYRADLARLEAQRTAFVTEATRLAGEPDASPQEVGRALAAADAQFRAELALLREAARFHSLPAGELQAAIGSHVRALAGLELRFAQEGVASPTGMEATFRPAAPGIVEYVADPATRAFLEAYYREQGGTLTVEGDRLVGEIDGRRTHYVPKIEAGGPGTIVRTAHAASLEGSLGDLAGRVDIRENPALPGRSARVRIVGGRVVIEVGSRATAEDLASHLAEARYQLEVTGPLGRLRGLQDRLLTLLRIRPGRTTLGGEAAREILKLREVRARLLELEAGLTGGAREADRLADVERQLAYYEGQLGSYERGRGYVAAFDTVTGAVTELRERLPADQVTANGEVLTINGTVEISRAQLEALAAALPGASRTNGIEELADLSRALRAVGGDESRLSTELQNRLAVLRAAAPDLAVQPTEIPARDVADPLALPATATLPARAEAAAARAARLLRTDPGPVDRVVLDGLLGQLLALIGRIRTARTPAEQAALETELAARETSLGNVEQRHADAIVLQRAAETGAYVANLATDVPDRVTPRLGETELQDLQSLRDSLELMRDPGLFDRVELDRILGELASLRARLEAQQAADIARAERLGVDALSDVERELYVDNNLTLSAADAAAIGIGRGRLTPVDLNRLSADQLLRLIDIVNASGRDRRYVADLREREGKARHRARRGAAPTGGVDALVTAILDGAPDVAAGSRADADAVVARLRVALQPSATGEQPSFHGPESHRGTTTQPGRLNTAPDDPHLNAEGYWRGEKIEVHIYFP